MYNKAILIGRMTADPELKQTKSGIFTTTFCIAVDRRFKGQDGERNADFINIVAWRQTAEFVCKYFHKGDAIGIDGNIQVRSYEDLHGNTLISVPVVADHIFFVGSKREDKPSERYRYVSFPDFPPAQPAHPVQQEAQQVDFEDVTGYFTDIPF